MIQQIAKLLTRTPFHAFAIVTTNGNEYRVDHPENAAIVAGRLVVALPNDEGIVTLGKLHLAELKDFSPAADLQAGGAEE
jgi:hypothetical protein